MNNYDFLYENYFINKNGWIAIGNLIDGIFKQTLYHTEEIQNTDYDNKRDIYISQNLFFKKSRKIKYLKQLNMLFVDIDTYNVGLTNEQVLYNLKADYFNVSIPIPNFIISSGRGLYLLWKINEPSSKLNEWKRAVDYLVNTLAQFGADFNAKDASRVLRIPGTINSKSNSVVKILEINKYQYTLDEILEEFVPERFSINEEIVNSSIRSKTKNRDKTFKVIHNKPLIYDERIKDLLRLCKLRKYKMTGSREVVLFLYRYWRLNLDGDSKEVLKDVLKLNSMFDEPLFAKEVIEATKSAESAYNNKVFYNYTNDTLINILQISENEQMKLKTIISSTERKRRKKERNKKHYADRLRAGKRLTKKEEIAIKKVKIKKLYIKGYSINEICKKIKISRTSYYRYIKDMDLIKVMDKCKEILVSKHHYKCMYHFFSQQIKKNIMHCSQYLEQKLDIYIRDT